MDRAVVSVGPRLSESELECSPGNTAPAAHPAAIHTAHTTHTTTHAVACAAAAHASSHTGPGVARRRAQRAASKESRIAHDCVSRWANVGPADSGTGLYGDSSSRK